MKKWLRHRPSPKPPIVTIQADGNTAHSQVELTRPDSSIIKERKRDPSKRNLGGFFVLLARCMEELYSSILTTPPAIVLKDTDTGLFASISRILCSSEIFRFRILPL